MEKKNKKITIKCTETFKRRWVRHCRREGFPESWLGLRYLTAGMKQNPGEPTLAKKKTTR